MWDENLVNNKWGARIGRNSCYIILGNRYYVLTIRNEGNNTKRHYTR